MTTSQNELFTRLEDLLDEERETLLKAEFTGLPKVLDEKIQLISILEQTPASGSVLQRLKAKITHNQVLLDEAMAAIRSTTQRLADLRYNRRSVSTYNHMGQKRLLQPDADISVEKKA